MSNFDANLFNKLIEGFDALTIEKVNPWLFDFNKGLMFC